MTAIRNIGIVAHVDAGKTTTTEHLLYTSGRIRHLGRVDEGTAHTDWLGIERDRGISVRSAVTRFTWRDTAVNLIDTPGHVDFAAEVERVLAVLDGVVLIVSAADGVQAHTETLWHALRMHGIPTIIYVNKVDRLGVNLEAVMDEMKRVLHSGMVPVQVVDCEGPEFSRVEGIFDGWAEDSIDSNVKSALETCRAVLAETDETLLQAYVDDLPIRQEELFQSLIRQVYAGHAFPVLFGASLKGVGIGPLLDAMVDYIPNTPRLSSEEDDVSGLVFKMERDKAHGRVAYVRLFTGTLRNRDIILNQTRGIEEKVTQIREIDVDIYRDTGVLHAGDVAAVYGFSQSKIGDRLGVRSDVREIRPFSTPLITVQVLPDDPTNLMALVDAMQELDVEDPALSVEWLPNQREIHMLVMGSIQLEVIRQLVLERFQLSIQFGPPSVVYKETPVGRAEGYVHYTMPKPCWAVLRFEIEPGEPGSGVSYTSDVRTEDLLAQYQAEVERRIPEALAQGLYGWEVTDLRIRLVEGEHHVWHTHPLDFVVATPMAIMDGLENAGTRLLEPILQFRLSVPEELGGRVLGDLSQMRAVYDSPVIRSGRFVIEGDVPLTTSLDYPTRLGILTGGRGVFSTQFLEYRACPPEIETRQSRRGVDPRDTSKYILWVRGALAGK